MEIDIKKIRSRIDEIEENLLKIRKYTNIPDEEFWEDERNIYTIKHLLLQTIEAVGAICVHLVAKKLKKGVESFGECFEQLAKAKMISSSLYQELKSMIRFRNILVHRYWEIEDEKVLQYARKNLEDFKKFLEEIKEILIKKKS
jgi:uncharacterized protein YutE (UPF0331/DUF86 family)